jgi:hypothetical protein
MDVSFELLDELVVEMMAVSRERYSKACVLCRVGAKFSEAGIECGFAAAETDADCPVFI